MSDLKQPCKHVCTTPGNYVCVTTGCPWCELDTLKARIAELERDAGRLTELEKIFKHCPTAKIVYNDDEDAEDEHGMVSVGFTLQIYDVEEPISFVSSTLRSLIDLAAIDAQIVLVGEKTK